MKMKLTNEYVSFGALLVVTGTGLAVIVIGACLLSWNAYLSLWMPSWTWAALGGFTVLGVGIAATSVAAAIATISPNPPAAHKCLVILLMFLAVEVGISSMSAYSQPRWSANLYLGLRQTMYDTLGNYAGNQTSKAMWDEIELEMNCCGVESYKDWFTPLFEDGSSVPDSCCLLPSTGCGKDIKNSVLVDDLIETQGCLPTIAQGWKHTYDVISKQALLPICIIQVIMIVVITLSYRRAGLLHGHLPLIIRVPEEGSQETAHKYSPMP